MAEAEKELTYGQKAVGLSFNHAEGGLHDTVHEVKQQCADMIDLVESLRTPNDSRFKNTLVTMATTTVLAAQMAVVKVLTWKDAQ